MAKFTLEQIQEALDKTGLDSENLDIKDFAKLAGAIKEGNLPEATKSESKTGTSWSIELEKYPDFVIKRTTPKTVQMLVIMPSCKGYYIKSVKNGKVVDVKNLTEDEYVKFTAGMPEIKFSDNMWIESIYSGKRFYRKFNICINDQDYIDMVKYGIAPKIKEVRLTWDNKYINDKKVMAYKTCPILFRENYEDDRVIDSFFHEMYSCVYPEGTKALYPIERIIKKFGLNNARNFIDTFKISLVQGAGRYHTEADIFNCTAFADIMTNNEFHYAEFCDYVLYHSVFMGYGQDMIHFWQDWSDTLNMQTDLYGKIKDKYPKDLPMLHQQLSYKLNLHKTIIDEKKFTEHSNHLKKYEMNVDGFSFIVPKKADDMHEEAQSQANCLASYIGKFTKGETEIFFMRRQNLPEESYITIEKRGDVLAQIYYARNKTVSDSDYKVAQKWMAKCKKIDEEGVLV